MSDYMFMLDNHLSANQSGVITQLRAVAEQANVNLFLTGGAMRDMLGGFPIRDLDFSVEGNALKLAKTVAQKAGARVIEVDEHRKSVELLFPGDVTASITMARQERHGKIGAKPHVSPATIYEDLRGRDFTFNAMALSLNRASLGLLIDPNNGFADLERKEIRAIHNYVLYDDPERILRLVRSRVRFGFAVDERTQQQYENARLEALEKHIPLRRLFEELKRIASDPDPGAVLHLLEAEKLLGLFSTALAGPKLNLGGFARLQKARQMIPFGVEFRLDEMGLFFSLLTEKLTPGEKTALVKAAAMRTSEVNSWQKLDARSRKSERELKSAKLRKASQIYQVASNIPGEEILYSLLHSSQRLVQDRIKNYLQKYLPGAQEITEKQVIAAGGAPGTAGFRKLREEMIVARLDGRLKKPPEGFEGQEAALESPGAGRPKGPEPPRKVTDGTNRSQDVLAQHKPRGYGARSQ